MITRDKKRLFLSTRESKNKAWQDLNNGIEQFIRDEPKFNALQSAYREIVFKWILGNNTEKPLYSPGEGSENKSYWKGLALLGAHGQGKTTIMKGFEYMINQFANEWHEKHYKLDSKQRIGGLKYVSIFDIQKAYECEPCEAWKYLNRPLIIGELGRVEKNLKSYGNNKEIIEEFFEYRNLNKVLTFIEGNISLEDIGDKYGSHVLNRIGELCVIVTNDEVKKPSNYSLQYGKYGLGETNLREVERINIKLWGD